MSLPMTLSTNDPSISWSDHWPTRDEIFSSVPEELLTRLDRYLVPHFQSANDHNASDVWSDDALSKIQYSVAGEWVPWIRSKLQSHPGFCCLSFPDGRYNETQMRLAYFLIARELGILDNRYGYLFDVADRGLDYTQEAIPISKTNAATSFHTDSTALDYTPDVVGLLCIHPALRGGENRLANAADLYVHLEKHHADSLQWLSQPIVRDVITPGREQNIETIRRNQFPLFSLDRGGLRFRYMRFWIEQAYSKLGEQIPGELIEIMNSIDRYFDNNKHIYRLTLNRGDMVFINNAFLCHDRTAFVDFDSPQKKRTLVRTWICWP